MLRLAELDERKARAKKKRNLVTRRLGVPAIINIDYGGRGGMSSSIQNGFLFFFANTGLKLGGRVCMPMYSHKHKSAYTYERACAQHRRVSVALVDRAADSHVRLFTRKYIT